MHGRQAKGQVGTFASRQSKRTDLPSLVNFACDNWREVGPVSQRFAAHVRFDTLHPPSPGKRN